MRRLTNLETAVFHKNLSKDDEAIVNAMSQVFHNGNKYEVFHYAMELLRDNITNNISEALNMAVIEFGRG